MSRARATALALVNWKGVFYERYWLDRHVTALEGANGAGKTTVMIAAYVVLLPDLARLRFTNLGETGATGGDKGIWGRLGAMNRPSYAALEIELPGGTPIIAGVQLLRKGEPTLELTPFIIRGVALEGRLREILLVTDGDDELVPELPEVRAAVARAGGTIEVCATIKDYFTALFDSGVTPLRMATDEDRKKYSEMLRTSMTGGISRALTSDLRGFLLQEQTGLGDALAQMRGNLDACHRTRIEVAEARRLEHEITGVYDAGQSAFAAAILATRTDADDLGRRVAEARDVHEGASRELRALDEAITGAEARLDAYAPRVSRARAAYADAMTRCERMAQAVAVAKRVAELEHDLAGATAVDQGAQRARQAADERRDACRLRRDQAREAYDRAAAGLADMQSGLEELHRNAHAYRHARRQLDAAREALDEPLPEDADLDARIEATRAEVARLDGERAAIDRDVESAAARHDEYARALAVLEEVAGPVDVAQAHAEARRALARLGDFELQQTRVPELAAEAERTRQLGGRQASVRARAAELGVEADGGPSSLVVQRRLLETETELRAAEEDARRHEQAAADARRALDDARRRIADLEATTARWKEASAGATRLEAVAGHPVRTRDALAQLRGRLSDERDAARRLVADLKVQRDAGLRDATRLESAAIAFHPELLQLRDELDGELLATRFEDLDVTEAAHAQARLGAMSDAIVVDDPAAAARRLAGRPRELASIWLVEAGSGFAVDTEAQSQAQAEWVRGGAQGDDLVVREANGVRVVRVPREPTLGRRARERRAAEMRAQAARLDGEIEKTLETFRATDALAREAERLVGDAALLEAGDPSGPITRTRDEATNAARAEQAGTDAAAAARARAAGARPRIESLRGLLADAFLLDAPDQGARAGAVHAALKSALEARTELDRVGPARAALSELADALRHPPDAGHLAARAADRAKLDAERERLFRAAEALTEVAAARHALVFADAERALAERSAVVPALETQLATAREAGRTEEALLRQAEGAWETATAAAQETSGKRQAIEAHVARERSGLDPATLQAASDAALAAAREAVSERDVERAGLERDERALSTEIALLRERRQVAERAATTARAHVVAEEALAGPAAAHWAAVRRAAERAGVLRGLVAARLAEGAGRDARDVRPASWPEARSRAEVLLDRLAGARGGADCAPHVEAAIRALESDAGGAHLAAWLEVRDWVKRRLPAQVADAPDPLDALERLQSDLGMLEERLAAQELDLRGASEDIARGLDVQLRKATHTLRRLNQSLEGVAFGSIAGIRVQMRRVERMDQVLRALREGAAQELLFQTTLPIDEALDEIFRRFGGGRTGGQRILDYREYVELGVEIRRRSSAAGSGTAGAPAESWEPALPTRLSTGEAIGVGAALMMVILTEWERDANLLRGKRAPGSLRFLFLDEANRLSQDNLGVLFDLCKNLDLQLLIAAPEVARSEGNTTYRLVRRVAEGGGEEVIVSGRRTVATP